VAGWAAPFPKYVVDTFGQYLGGGFHAGGFLR
jgi:hypothetical protein